jgi:hypothetical protein
MENLTYRDYCADLMLRKEIDAEVRRLQREAVEEYVVAPLVRMWKRMVSRAHAAPVRAVAKTTDSKLGAPT